MNEYQDNYSNPETITKDMLPPQYRPLGAWAYFGYSILFAIPIIGFILLIVFSFSNSNINRRNFARSHWCILAIVAIIVAIILATAGTAGLAIGGFGLR